MIMLLMKNYKSKLYHIRKTDEAIEALNKKSEITIQKYASDAATPGRQPKPRPIVDPVVSSF